MIDEHDHVLNNSPEAMAGSRCFIVIDDPWTDLPQGERRDYLLAFCKQYGLTTATQPMTKEVTP